MRGTRWALRIGAAALVAGGALLLGTGPAAAAATISINPGNIPATAAGYPTKDCSQTGGSSTLDGWVFVLPGNKGQFVSLTLTFKTSGGATVVVSVPPSGTISSSPASKAWVQTPAGYTLVAATATINGTSSSGYFNLTHTCPATGSPSPSPSSESPTPSESPSTEPPGTPTPSDPSSSSSSGTASALAAVADAVTSPAGAVGGLLFLGSGLAGGMSLLQYARRRRDEWTA